MKLKRCLNIFFLWLFGDWFSMRIDPKYRDKIFGPAQGMRIWGIYHKFRWHRWSYDLTYNEALAQINSLNNQILQGTLDDIELQTNYDEVVKREIKQ